MVFMGLLDFCADFGPVLSASGDSGYPGMVLYISRDISV